MYYWTLKLKDETEIRIPPHQVEVVKKQIRSRGTISTKLREILFSEVESFQASEERYSPNQSMINAVSQAFNEPIYTEDGSIEAHWVKKPVPRQKWDKFYAPSGYKMLEESGASIMIAFVVPTHLIDTSRVQYCTKEELEKLNGKVG
jgi:hypothetical protein